MPVAPEYGRRGFIRRLARAPVARLDLPPWAVEPDRFTGNCTRCNACVEACPAGILSAGDGGFPSIDFKRGACTFCHACADACRAACFHDGEPWARTAVVSEACIERHGVSCRLCEGACEAQAIRFRPRLGGGAELRIDPTACTGCGACVAPCPVGAIASVHPLAAERRT